MARLNVIFLGRVQGVGFRITVKDLAESFSVTGRVCNRSDGSVALRAEGEEAELLQFKQAIEQRMSRNIVDQRVEWRSVSVASWDDFLIDADEIA